ncbi:MAG: pyridoxal phosphate-dependent aminotransferase [Pseudomonadota bacterium]
MTRVPEFRFTPVIKALPSIVPFVGPDEQERQSGIKFRARLGANESCFGPSPRVIEAMNEASELTWQYADPDNHDLRSALAEFYGVSFDNVMVGEGIDGLLGCTAHMFVEPGVHVVTSLGSYPTFNFHIKSRGGTLHLVPYKDDCEDPEALLAKARETNAALLYFSNPNNPMGTFWSAHVMENLISEIPEGTMLVLDEAYIECAPEGVSPAIDVTNRQVLRFRTFSKLYGMAGARIGYVIGHPDVIATFDKVRNHYGINLSGQRGALAAIGDQQYLSDVKEKVRLARARIETIARQNDLEPIPSATNFVTIDCRRDTAFAKAVLTGLLNAGVFIRMPGVEPQSRCIRVSAGVEEELDILEEVLPGVLAVLD